MSRFCTNCGATLEDNKKFCTECGTPVNAAEDAQEAAPFPHPVPQAQAAVPEQPRTPAMQQTIYGGDAPPPPGSKYEPITTGGFIGIMLLMGIPVVGQILMIVWACGGCRKVNKRSLARAALIMMVVMLVISFLIGLALKSLFDTVVDAIEEETGINITEITGTGDSGGDSGLSGLLGIIGGLSGEGGSGVTNRDIEELEEMEKMLDGLEGVTGEESGLDGLIDGAIEANREAEALNDGWPSTLRAYPGGEANAVASYRTEISGTTLEEMMGWIEDLKGDGFAYQDFYDFGMTEQDMLDMNGWWAYDGKTYLSVSFYEGTVTVDHTKELPDLESYFN